MAGSKDFRRDMMALTPEVPEVDLSVLNLPELPEQLPVSSPEDRKGYCACIASLTMARHRLAFTSYTSSLTAYEPEAVTGFTDAMAAMVQEGACGGLPGAGGTGE